MDRRRKRHKQRSAPGLLCFSMSYIYGINGPKNEIEILCKPFVSFFVGRRRGRKKNQGAEL